MKIVFMGTPEFAIPSLQSLVESSHQVVGVVTAPDRPTGRGLKIQPSPVKQCAIDYNLPVLQPENLKDEQFLKQLKSLDADLFTVVGFRILPEIVFSIPPKGTINLHASLLPAYRGAAPINWAIINGETETGVTIFFIEKNVDTGNLILQEKVAIEPEENAGMLHDKLMNIGAELLLEAVDSIESGDYIRSPQIGEVTLAPKLEKALCEINWQKESIQIHNLIRGLSPCPGAYSHLNGKNIKIFSSRLFDSKILPETEPGTIIELNQKAGFISVATGNGVLALTALQMEGKKCMCASEFLKGCHINVGDKFQ